jgi:hypothetical protein
VGKINTSPTSFRKRLIMSLHHTKMVIERVKHHFAPLATSTTRSWRGEEIIYGSQLQRRTNVRVPRLRGLALGRGTTAETGPL